MDLKARHVTAEELSHTIGCHLNEIKINDGQLLFSSRPSQWWDRSCDLALIIGTFYHGLSNYQAMFTDETLPFSRKIDRHRKGLDCSQAIENFKCISQSVTAVFGEAISAYRAKQKVEKERKSSPENVGTNLNNDSKIDDKESIEQKSDNEKGSDSNSKATVRQQ